MTSQHRQEFYRAVDALAEAHARLADVTYRRERDASPRAEVAFDQAVKTLTRCQRDFRETLEKVFPD